MTHSAQDTSPPAGRPQGTARVLLHWCMAGMIAWVLVSGAVPGRADAPAPTDAAGIMAQVFSRTRTLSTYTASAQIITDAAAFLSELLPPAPNAPLRFPASGTIVYRAPSTYAATFTLRDHTTVAATSINGLDWSATATVAAAPPSGTPHSRDSTLAAVPPSGTPHPLDRTSAAPASGGSSPIGSPSPSPTATAPGTPMVSGGSPGTSPPPTPVVAGVSPGASPGTAPPATLSGPPEASPGTAPSAVVSGSPGASPPPTPVVAGASPAPAGPTTISATLARSPLAFLFPYNVWSAALSSQWQLSGDQLIYDTPCYRLTATTPQTGPLQMWVSKADFSVRRMEFEDSAHQVKYAALFRDFEPSPDGPWLPRTVDVTRDGKAFLTILVSNVVLNAPGSAAAPPGPVRISRQGTQEVPLPPAKNKFLEWVMALAGFALLAWGGWMAGRKIIAWKHLRRLAATKPVFSAACLVVGGDPVIKALESVGLVAEAATVELVGASTAALAAVPPSGTPHSRDSTLAAVPPGGTPHSRDSTLAAVPPSGTPHSRDSTLATPGGEAAPRIVVVGPNGMAQVKDLLEPLYVYVHAGGRVLLLPHGLRTANQLPFHNMLESVDPLDTTLVYTLELPIWRRIPENEVTARHMAVIPWEVYYDGSESAEIKKIVGFRNGDRPGTAIGMVEQGKGYYLLCQYRLSDALSRGQEPGVAGNMLLDLIDFMIR